MGYPHGFPQKYFARFRLTVVVDQNRQFASEREVLPAAITRAVVRLAGAKVQSVLSDNRMELRGIKPNVSVQPVGSAHYDVNAVDLFDAGFSPGKKFSRKGGCGRGWAVPGVLVRLPPS